MNLLFQGCTNEDRDVEELPDVWLCLQCGYRGCGRSSENKHAIQHFRTLHSDCHSLVLSTSSGSVWYLPILIFVIKCNQILV